MYRHLYEAFQQTPSHKFLTLVYQVSCSVCRNEQAFHFLSPQTDTPDRRSAFLRLVPPFLSFDEGSPGRDNVCAHRQMASRMSSSTSGPLHASGFYKVLEGIMFRLAVEHPYHTLYQIFALKNGKRPNMDGRGWEHTVDESKVVSGIGTLLFAWLIPHACRASVNLAGMHRRLLRQSLS